MVSAREQSIRKIISNELKQGSSLGEAAESAARTISGFVEMDTEMRTLLEQIVDEVRQQIGRVSALDITTLDDRRFHDWYQGPQPDDVHWPALKEHLRDIKGWNESTVNSIDEASTNVLSRFAPPASDEYSIRGLVVGHVQSGKTVNMTSVIAKAVDRGFKLVVVFAGTTDALRLQTQRRLEADLVHHDPPRWFLLTESHLGGDFDGGSIGSIPAGGSSSQIKLAVIKKRVSRLGGFLEKLNATAPAARWSMPALLIDDESDQASVNVGTDEDPSGTNDLIRRIIGLLPRAVYLGYTATPFANVLINPRAVGIDENVADDLYPRDFIQALPTPEQYFGPEKLFGRDLIDGDDVPQEESGMDIIRIIRDSEAAELRPLRRQIQDFSPRITPTLHRALRWFVLATAIRDAPAEHSTMLIHTTELQEGHSRLRAVVDEALQIMMERLAADEPEEIQAFHDVWKQEEPALDRSLPGRSWDQIVGRIRDVTVSIELIEENAQSEERLDYSGSGRRYVVIGGNILSRGLTLEGLVVSYFLRPGRQYDTLLQMGRWFGYRHGYEDLPRIWMTRGVFSAFKNLATVEAEIRRDIEIYARDGLTPLDFAVRIRQIPGMLITRRAAMRTVETCDVSYSGEHVQTFRFYHRDKDWLRENWRAGAQLIEAAAGVADDQRMEGGWVYPEVPVEVVIRFLSSYRVHDSHRQIRPQYLREYIQKYEEQGLSQWSVGVVTTRSGVPSELELGPLGRVNTVSRAKLEAVGDEDADIKALMSRQDILLDTGLAMEPGATWESLKQRRAEHYADAPPGLLLLYPIYAGSEPRAGAKARAALNAAGDVLGLGVVFPGRATDARRFIRVRLDPEEAEGDDEE